MKNSRPFSGPFDRNRRDSHNNRETNSGIRTNEDIKAQTVRLLDGEGGMLGIFTIRDARDMASREGKDLVEIAPQANPPVCKIIDFGKYLYEQHKRDKEQKKKIHTAQLKEIRFKAQTDTHDFDFKTRHARDFLMHGDKVKASVMFRGREMQHQEFGEILLKKFIERLEEVSKVDQPLRSEGRTMAVTLSPDKDKIKKLQAAEKPMKKDDATDAVSTESTGAGETPAADSET
ncbi:MAG: translation initiation factor IF-3 [Candidatus Kapaibacterium sp.]